MAAIQVEQSTIDMLRQTPIDASKPNMAQMADATSKIMPIMTRMAEISNMHGTAIQRDKYFAPKAKNKIATHMSRSGNSGGSNLT